MDHFEKRNNAMRIQTHDLLKLTENLRLSKFITENYLEKAEPLKDITEKIAATNLEETGKVEKVESVKKENKENEATVVIRKNKKSWICPEIESIDQSCFDSLNRHQKGRLKYSQLINAIAEVTYSELQLNATIMVQLIYIDKTDMILYNSYGARSKIPNQFCQATKSLRPFCLVKLS